MAANITCLTSTALIRKTLERSSTVLPAFCCSSWWSLRSTQQSHGYHTSEFLCGGRLKSEWRRKRAPALTKLCLDKSEKFKTRKAFGGGSKTKVTRAKKGSYLWKSQNVHFETPILDVAFNTAHKDFTEKKIMVKGTIVEVNGEKFATWLEEECESKEVKQGMKNLSKNIDDKVVQQIKDGRVLAKVSSRPGQEGKVDGYLLEGKELDEYLDETKDLTAVLNSKT